MTRNRPAGAVTPGNAKLAAILANKGTMVGEPESVPSASSTLGNAKQAADLLANTRSEIGDLTGPAPAAVETPGNAKLAAILANKNTDPQIGVLGSTSAAAAAALTPGNAKLAAILANKGAKIGVVAASERAVTVTADPSTLVASLLAGLTEPGWKGVLSDTLQKSESFSKLAVFLEEERLRGETVYPPSKDIFAALNLCPLDAVKVVIVGQDPYHGSGQGHGLAFSVRKGVRPPPSLLNIFKEVIDDVGIDDPKHGNLECWARQGVLLLNTVLTVREGEANSHAGKGWEEVTDAIIREVSERNQRADSCGLVFLLWGNAAAKKVGRVLIDEDAHTTIQTSHPSPLGATKTKSPFLGSRCFSLANKALIAMGLDPVNWSVE